MLALVLLSCALGLDSFRASLGLGALRPGATSQRWAALAFGVCDGVAPLLGLAAGGAALRAIGPWVGYLGPIVLAGYGGITIYRTLRPAALEREAKPWILLGLPLSLSLDNLVAGTGLGMLGFPVLLTALFVGLTSGLMSLAGLWLGRALRSVALPHAEVIGGCMLVLAAGMLLADAG